MAGSGPAGQGEEIEAGVIRQKRGHQARAKKKRALAVERMEAARATKLAKKERLDAFSRERNPKDRAHE